MQNENSNSENPTDNDLRDRLIDGALRELVGQETPPDLSEKIMFAATGEKSRQQVTRAPGADDMAIQHQQVIKQRNQWVGISIAATVLVGALFVYPLMLAQRERARNTPPTAIGGPLGTAKVTRDQDGRLNLNAAETNSTAEAAKETDAASDFESLVDVIEKTVDTETWQKNDKEQGELRPFTADLDLIISQTQRVNEQPKDGEGRRPVLDNPESDRGGPTVDLPEFEMAPVSSNVEVPDRGTILLGGVKRLQESGDRDADELITMITPHIIIQEEEQERLGFITDGLADISGEGSEESAPEFKPSSAPGQIGLQGVINDAYAGMPVASSAPSSQDKPTSLPSPYYLTDDIQYYAPGPESKLSGETASRSDRRYVKRWAEQVRGGSTAYEESLVTSGVDPNAKRGLWGMDMPPILAPQSGEKRTRAKYAQRGVKVYPVEDLILPTQNEAGSSLGDLAELDRKRSADETVPALQREASRELYEKMNRYQKLSTELGGSSSPVQNPELKKHYREVRQLQKQIVESKAEIVDLALDINLAKMHNSSTSALESAIADQLNEDPAVQAYKAKEITISQQLKDLRANSKAGTYPQLKRLEESLQALRQESYRYCLSTEQEIRKELKSRPNEILDLALTEYVLRRRNTEARLAKLSKEYGKKVAAIQKLGDQGSELALLEAEIDLLRRLEKGRGPEASGDKYARIYENPFVKAVGEKAVSTFSIDVDTASYANVRQFLAQSGQLPPPDAVRIEELVNYFDYDYTAPTDDTPFASHVEVAGCPWKAGHRLVRVGIKGREIDTESRPQSNLVFLIDVSGSMNEPAKLPLLVEGMKMLTRKLGENDRIAIVVYASSEGLALPSTRGDQQATILAALEKLRAGGSTAGGAGIQLAYEIAEKNFIKGGVNRVILATDGDFNVGTTDEGSLTRMAENKSKDTGVFLTVLGFGRGNLNDSMMEQISGAGNGNYYYIDNTTEARKVLVAEMAGTLVTIAKDVKIQIEFNPAQVAAYRLIGYENRMLKTEDFNDDKKDAGEIGAGHTVTAIYEVVPAGQPVDVPGVDPLKYQQPTQAKPASDAEASDEMLTLKLRYKEPDGETSTKLEFPISDNGQSFSQATDDFKFASAVASFGMLLRHSEHQGHTSYSAVEEIAQDGTGTDQHGYRAEFLQLVRQARALAGE